MFKNINGKKSDAYRVSPKLLGQTFSGGRGHHNDSDFHRNAWLENDDTRHYKENSLIVRQDMFKTKLK